MTYAGFCHELNREMLVSREALNSQTLNDLTEKEMEGLLDCRYASNCKYYKDNNRCELES